jgi:hypothetical protein
MSEVYWTPSVRSLEEVDVNVGVGIENFNSLLIRQGPITVYDSPGPARAFTKSLRSPWIVL